MLFQSLQLILVLKSLKQYETTTTKVIIQVAAHVLAYMNSCVNPFLYAFLSDNFRKAFRKVNNPSSASCTQNSSFIINSSEKNSPSNYRKNIIPNQESPSSITNNVTNLNNISIITTTETTTTTTNKTPACTFEMVSF